MPSTMSASGTPFQLVIPTFVEVLEETTGAMEHAELKSVLRRLLERGRQLRDLPAGWNSYGATPPPPETLEFALLFAARTCVFLLRNGLPLVEPFLVPTAEGGIQCEWSCGSRELEIEIHRPGVFSFLAVKEDREQEGTCPEEEAFQHLRWLATGEWR